MRATLLNPARGVLGDSMLDTIVPEDRCTGDRRSTRNTCAIMCDSMESDRLQRQLSILLLTFVPH